MWWTRKSTTVALSGLVALSTIGLAQAAELSISVDAHDVARKRIHTDVQLQVKPGPLTLAYPKWIPGEHGPTGPLDSLIGLTVKANGKVLAWTRDPLDIYAIRMTVPNGVQRLDISLETGLPTGGEGFSGAPTSSSNLAILPWNAFVLAPKGRDAEQISVSAKVLAPAGWNVVSALEAKLNEGAYQFEPASLARLIDSPVQMGRYAKQIALDGAAPRPDLRHVISLFADTPEALDTPADFAASYSRLVAEAGALFGTRMYRHYTWLVSLSDHVAHFGLEHHESSDDRRELDVLSTPEQRMTLATLLGHEYVHSWNGKYRRPKGLLSADFQEPMDASLLWSYEGMTEFWGYILPVRSGLMSEAFYRDDLARAAATFELSPGARWRPLGDTAVAAQQLYNSPGSWSASRRSVDFYDASMFMWLDVDSELRDRTQGKASLDDYVQRFYAGAPGAPQLKPYVEQDIYDTLNALAPNDWRKFMRRHLDETSVAPLLGGLEHAGWKLAYTTEKNLAVEASEKQGKFSWRTASIGLVVAEDGAVLDTIEDRAAAKAGIGPGMKITAVDGQKYSIGVLDAALLRAQADHKPIELLVESDDFFRTLAVDYYDGPRFPHLVRNDSRPDTLSKVIAAHAKAAGKP